MASNDDTGSVLSQQFGGGYPGKQMQNAAPPLRLPAVPGAQPPPTPSQRSGVAAPRYAEPTPGREIRMVYHKPNGDSRISIFARGPVSPYSRGGYNPITHQSNDAFAAGSRYHSRHEPSQHGMGAYPHPRSLAQQYTAQRRRVTPSHWY